MDPVLLITLISLWTIVLLNLLLTLAIIRRLNAGARVEEAKPTPNGLEVGEKAPDFSAETLEGSPVSLATYTGKPTAFIFIKPNCEPCEEDLPDYMALYSVARRAGAELVLVSVGPPEDTRKLADEFQIHNPLLIAPQDHNSFMSDYKMRGTPSYTYVNAQGIIQSVGRPSRNKRNWKEVISAWESARPTVVEPAMR